MKKPAQLAAIAAVLAIASVAWFVLGGVMRERTSRQDGLLVGRVADMWGIPQHQAAPTLRFLWTTSRQAERTETVAGKARTWTEEVKEDHAEGRLPASSDIQVKVHSDPRRKGLIWYSFYDLSFAGKWTCKHGGDVPGNLEVGFTFPDPAGLYDGFRFVVDGKDLARDLRPVDGVVSAIVPVQPGQVVTLEIAYRTRGTEDWRYVPAAGVANLENFTLAMDADFADIDFPNGTLSPSSKQRAGKGWNLIWRFEQVVTGHGFGIAMPRHVQPGELASALSFSAPVSLMFFFLLLVVRTNLRGIDVHPVNYLFLAAAFFAFHILFGYLVDHVPVIPAFAIGSAVSVFLVVSYLRLVVSIRFAFVEALSQLVYLVGFSLAHFWEGYTGLTVTVLSILTLYMLMQVTGRIRWSRLDSAPAEPPPPAGG